MKLEQIVETLYKALPYSDQIRNVEFRSDTIYFDWRGTRFRIDSELGVESVEGEHSGILASCDKSILLEALLKRTHKDEQP